MSEQTETRTVEQAQAELAELTGKKRKSAADKKRIEQLTAEIELAAALAEAAEPSTDEPSEPETPGPRVEFETFDRFRGVIVETVEVDGETTEQRRNCGCRYGHVTMEAATSCARRQVKANAK